MAVDRMFLDAADRAPGSPALVEAATGTTWTYAQLAAAVDAGATALTLAHKGAALWISRTVPEAIAGYLAALASGHAVLPVPSNLHASLFERLLDTYQPEFLISLSDDPIPPSAAAGYDVADLDLGSAQALRVWRRRTSSDGAVYADLRLLLSTSGSTGSPKMVRLSRRNLESNASGILSALGIDAQQCAIASLPLHYSFGLSVLHSHLAAGARIVLTERSLFEPEFWQAVGQHECTSFAGVPYMYGILKRLGFATIAPAALRTLTQAGGKMSRELIREFGGIMAARGGELYVMYGQTEATARITVLPSRLLNDKLGGVGFPLSGGQLEIRRSDDASSGSPEGDVLYRGPNVMLGYAESRRDLALGDVQQGTLDTGDIGYLDEDGCLFITGRRKRFAKVFGLRVSLDDIESRLAPHGPVAATGGDEAIVVFTTAPAADAVRAALAELARDVRLHASAFRVRTVAELPLLPTGKVDYPRLAESG